MRVMDAIAGKVSHIVGKTNTSARSEFCKLLLADQYRQ